MYTTTASVISSHSQGTAAVYSCCLYIVTDGQIRSQCVVVVDYGDLLAFVRVCGLCVCVRMCMCVCVFVLRVGLWFVSVCACVCVYVG